MVNKDGRCPLLSFLPNRERKVLCQRANSLATIFFQSCNFLRALCRPGWIHDSAWADAFHCSEVVKKYNKCHRHHYGVYIEVKVGYQCQWKAEYYQWHLRGRALRGNLQEVRQNAAGLEGACKEAQRHGSKPPDQRENQAVAPHQPRSRRLPSWSKSNQSWWGGQDYPRVDRAVWWTWRAKENILWVSEEMDRLKQKRLQPERASPLREAERSRWFQAGASAWHGNCTGGPGRAWVSRHRKPNFKLSAVQAGLPKHSSSRVKQQGVGLSRWLRERALKDPRAGDTEVFGATVDSSRVRAKQEKKIATAQRR